VSEILTVFTLMSTHECLRLTFKGLLTDSSLSRSPAHTLTRRQHLRRLDTFYLTQNFTDLSPVCFPERG